MRAFAWLTLPATALLLLSAHLFHNGASVLAALPVVLVALLGLRRWWMGRLVQAVLLVATLEWGLTAAFLAQVRAGHGQPYARLVVILGSVALLTALAALSVQSNCLRAWFRLDGPLTGPSRDMPN